MNKAITIALAALGLSLAAVSIPARADGPAPPARCMLRVVHALPGEGGMDPAITRLRAWLQNPPFNQWKSFKLLSEKDQEIRPGGNAHYLLPNGKDAVVTYTEHKNNDKKHTVRGIFQIESARGATMKTAFSLDEGGILMNAGEAFNRGTLIYALSCKTED